MKAQYRPSPGRWGKHAASEAIRREMAQARRVQLIVELGPWCEICGETSLIRLEPDHKDGRTWSPRKTSQRQRVEIYWREAAQGKIRILCRSCNARKGATVEQVLRRAARAAGDAVGVPSWITDTFGGTESDLEPF